jgi:protein-S-isoprenylcysteine O-methyltransferase Ste14
MSVADRGAGWVVAQFALMALILAAAVVPPDWPDDARRPLTALGALAAVAGAGLAVWAGRALGRSFTPFPRPAADGALVESGPFRYVRHPVYSGGLVFLVGWSLYAGPVSLALTAALAVLWALKARVEERHLAQRYPGYATYAGRVRARLVPRIY